MESEMFSNRETAKAVAFDKDFFSNAKKEQMRVVHVFPALAHLWLEKRNRQNRSKGNANVLLYAREMTDGKWSLSNQGLGFDWDGQMTDGQTRLESVIQSGITVRMYVATGQDPINRLRVDCGRKRTTEHYLQMFADYTNPKIAGSALWCLRKFGVGAREKLTGEDIINLARSHRKSLEYICTAAGKGTWRQSAIIGSVAFAYPSAPDVVARAYEDLKSGADLHARDPILVFRNQFYGMRITGDAEREDAFMKLLAALYHRINGTQVSQLKRSEEAIQFFKGGKKKKASAYVQPELNIKNGRSGNGIHAGA